MRASTIVRAARVPGAAAKSALEVRVPGIAEHIRDGPGLDDLPLRHHRHPVGHLRRHPQIVRDEEHRELEPLAHVRQQVEHLRLDRDVERGHRLVRDQHVGLQGERAGDADALALAARELVRVAPERIVPETRRGPAAACARSSASSLDTP